MCFWAASVPSELRTAVTTSSSATCTLLIANTQLLQCRIRTAVPLVEEHVPLILQILDPHLRRPESAGGEVAEAAEESNRLVQSRIVIRGVGDLVEDGAALPVGQRGEPLVVALLAQAIDQ